MRKDQPEMVSLIEELNELKAKGEVFFEYTFEEGTHRIQKMFIADAR